MVNVEAVIPEGGTLEQVAEQEIAGFEKFFIEKLKNTKMTPSERAILKSYLYYALVERKRG